MHLGLFGVGIAAAHVAGTERQVSRENEIISRAIKGVSVKRQVLGQDVYNDQGEMVGKIDDLILAKKLVDRPKDELSGLPAPHRLPCELLQMLVERGPRMSGSSQHRRSI